MQEPREPRLRFSRQIAHVIEQQRAAVGLLDHAHHRRTLARACVAKEHGEAFFTVEFETGNFNKRLISAVRAVVHQARDEAFTSTRRAGDHQAAVGRCNAIDSLPQQLDRLAAANQVGVFASLLTQHSVLSLQGRGFECALDEDQQAVGVERLLNEVVGALLDGTNGRFNRAVTGHHDDRRVRDVLCVLFEQADAIRRRALKPDILKDQIRAGQTNLTTRFCVTVRGANTVAFIFQNPAEQHSDIGFIIYNENVGGH